MRILNILHQTMADGPGLRNSIYVAGCKHHCQGCHNPESWDMNGGKDISVDDIIKDAIDDYSNITISGGDPFFQIEEFKKLVQKIKQYNKNIWVYTGYTYDELIEMNNPDVNYILNNIDVLVDGPYIEDERDTSKFKGSKNQKIIYLKNGEIIKTEQ